MIDGEVVKILEDWFGQTLEDMENSEDVIKYLAQPLSDYIDEIYNYVQEQ